MTLQQFLTWIKELIEESAPALAVIFWDYKDGQVLKEKIRAQDAETKLQLEKNKELVNEKYSNSDDDDIVRDAISNGGGIPVQPSKGDKPKT